MAEPMRDDPTRRGDDRPVLLCLPFAGGGASAFFGWQNALGPGVEVRALQLPGRENLFHLAPLAEMGALADHLMPQVRAVAHRPLAVFGHSMGALVGYELCRRLEAEGSVPRALFASARKPPNVVRGSHLHSLTDEALKRRLRDFGGTPERILENESLMGMILPVLRADLRVAETYRPPPGPVLRCRIVACGAEDDALAPADAMEGWADHTGARFDLVRFAGGHFFLRSARAELAALIRETLAGALPGSTRSGAARAVDVRP